MRQTTDLNEHFPILEISYDGIVSNRGDLTKVFEVLKPELFSLSTPDLTTLHNAWVKAIGLLPFGTVLHLQDWYMKAAFEVNFDRDEPESFLTNSSNRFFHERPYRAHRCYLYLTRKFGSKRPVNSATSSLLNRSLVPEVLLEPAQIEEFTGQCEQFMQVLLEQGGINSRELLVEELTGEKKRVGLIEQYLSHGKGFSQPALKDIEFEDGVQIGDTKTLLYTLADAAHLPAECSPERLFDRYSNEQVRFPVGFAAPLGALLDADHVYNQYVLVEDPREALKKLETRQRRLSSLAGYSRDNAATHAAIGQYLQEAVTGKRPVKAHFNILAWPDSPEGLAELRNKLVSAISRLGAVPHQETIGAPQIWWAGLPGNAADLPVNETFDTFAEQAACFFIPESHGRSSFSPFGIRLGERQKGIPLHVDISDEPMRSGKIANRNKFILGGSGSGKSFFTNHLVRSYYEQGAHIVLVDIGGSYKGLCELLSGRYFAYSEKHPISFNPFYLPREEIMGTEKKESIKALLLTLWKKSDENFTRAEYTALSGVLEGYYAYLASDGDIFPCFNSFYEWVTKEFASRPGGARIREKEFDCKNFLYVLRPYYKGGEFDWLLNAREHIDVQEDRLIVFELDEIKDHPILFPVVTIVIMEVFINKMRKLHGIRKVILIEEAWKAIAKEGMSEYIRYLFKTVRKFFGEAIVVTQEVEDIISNHVVKNTILNQSDCKILLDMSKFMNRFGQLQELLGLTEKDKTMVLSLNKANEPGKKYKEVFIGLGSRSRVYRVEVSLEEYLVYTTEESEKVKVIAYAEKHGGIQQGVASLAADIRSGVVKLLMAAVICCAFLLAPNGRASAQIIDIVDEAIKEALEQADLAVQRVQTQTIALQDAEKELENNMTSGLLDDITGWAQDEEGLYSEYYQELWQVKTALSTYSKVEQLVQRQLLLVEGYQQATAAVRQDPHFSADELQHILNVYSGILNESIRNTAELATVIKAFVIQMDDAGRLRIIDETAGRIDRNYTDLQEYTQENTLLSLQRAKNEGDLATIKNLYGIP